MITPQDTTEMQNCTASHQGFWVGRLHTQHQRTIIDAIAIQSKLQAVKQRHTRVSPILFLTISTSVFSHVPARRTIQRSRSPHITCLHSCRDACCDRIT